MAIKDIILYLVFFGFCYALWFSSYKFSNRQIPHDVHSLFIRLYDDEENKTILSYETRIGKESLLELRRLDSEYFNTFIRWKTLGNLKYGFDNNTHVYLDKIKYSEINKMQAPVMLTNKLAELGIETPTEYPQ